MKRYILFLKSHLDDAPDFEGSLEAESIYHAIVEFHEQLKKYGWDIQEIADNIYGVHGEAVLFTTIYEKQII